MREVASVKEPVPAENPLQPSIAGLADHAQAMAAALRPLEAVTEQFLMPDDCLPAECDQALAALKALRVPADQMLQLLQQKRQYPPALALNRIDLLASLRFIETRSAEARAEIGRFRLVCQEWNPQTTHQRMAIHRRLEMMAEVGNEISDKVLGILGAFPVPMHLSTQSRKLI